MKINKKVIKATIIIGIVRIFDMITTYIAIKRWGSLGEGSPIVLFQTSRLGIIGGIISHYIWTTALVFFALLFIWKLDKKKFKGSYIALLIIFSLIVVWNIFSLVYLIYIR